ncbi:MAG: haloacid dehalogenase type II [bacterium]
MTINLKDITTLSFDCYGTLIDWESGIWDALQPLLMVNRVSHIDRKTALEEYARFEAAQEAETPEMAYPELMAQVHRSLAEKFALKTNHDLDHGFGASLRHWPAFPDTADALRILRRHFKLVILSNVNREGFVASNRKLGVKFNAIYTAQDVGSYKPNPANFAYMLQKLESDFAVHKDQILHTAQSLPHDHVQARKFGLANAWIDRQNLRDSDNWGATVKVEQRPEFDFYFKTMMEMAEYCDGARKS